MTVVVMLGPDGVYRGTIDRRPHQGARVRIRGDQGEYPALVVTRIIDTVQDGKPALELTLRHA